MPGEKAFSWSRQGNWLDTKYPYGTLALIDLKNAYFLTSIGKNDVYVLGKVSRFIESSMPLTMVFETCSFNCHYVLMY